MNGGGAADTRAPRPGGPAAPAAAGPLGLLVGLVALHSAALGVGAILAPAWGARFGGFAEPSPLFFVRQVGIFHVVVAGAYLIEWARYRGVTTLLFTKSCGVLFLCAAMAFAPQPWIVPVSAAGDALMGLVVWLVRRAPAGAGGGGAARA